MNNPTLNALITALRLETSTGAITPEALGSILQRMVDDTPEHTSRVTAEHIIYTEVVNGSLYLRGGYEKFLNDGFTPYIFRHSTKRNKLTISKTGDKVYGPKRKGWNRFFNKNKIQVNSDGLVLIFKHTSELLSSYVASTEASMLINEPLLELDNWRNCISLRVAHGRKMIECKHGARLTFAIAFAPEQKSVKFDYSTIVSNLAIFHVYVSFNVATKKPQIAFAT